MQRASKSPPNSRSALSLFRSRHVRRCAHGARSSRIATARPPLRVPLVHNRALLQGATAAHSAGIFTVTDPAADLLSEISGGFARLLLAHRRWRLEAAGCRITHVAARRGLRGRKREAAQALAVSLPSAGAREYYAHVSSRRIALSWSRRRGARTLAVARVTQIPSVPRGRSSNRPGPSLW